MFVRHALDVRLVFVAHRLPIPRVTIELDVLRPVLDSRLLNLGDVLILVEDTSQIDAPLHQHAIACLWTCGRDSQCRRPHVSQPRPCFQLMGLEKIRRSPGKPLLVQLRIPYGVWALAKK